MIELIGGRVFGIVTRAFDRYGYFPVQQEKRRLFDVCVDVVVSVTNELDNPAINVVRTDILKSVFILGLDNNKADQIFSLVFEEVEKELVAEEVRDREVYLSYRKYADIISEGLKEYEQLFKSDISDHLNLAYKPTEDIGGGFEVRSGVKGSGKLPVRFKDIFSDQVDSVARVVVNVAKDINEITSDSAVKDFFLPKDINPDLLTATFAGAGKSLFQDLSELFNASAEFGEYEGSVSGAVEYQSVYWEYLMAMSYGRVIKNSVLDEKFGKFDRLGFLSNLHKFCVESVNKTYENGVDDRWDKTVKPDEDFLSLVLEAVYVACLKTGDLVQSVVNFPPDKIGHTQLHMEILGAIFPSSSDLASRSTGITGGIEQMLSGHRRLYSLVGESGTYGVQDSFRSFSRIVSRIAETLKLAGFKPGGIVPSLELTYHEPKRSVIKHKLMALGFTGPEVENIMGVNSFSELLNQFAPLTDSDDVISFFRAFDLTKLIYEFGGQGAIDQYIDFLYGRNSDQSLTRLLEFLDVNRKQRSTIIGSKYSKLIGYLISLTYAVNPEKLQIFDGFLKRNNSDLLEAISTLIQRGEDTIILQKEAVSVLSGMLSQLVISDNSGYENQKPVWNKLIERSAGNSGLSTSGLYENRDGITPTELYQLLNNPSATSPIGEMLNGVRGGRVTSILRYCNLFGLLYSLSDFRNSYQLINNKAEEYRGVLDLVFSLDQLSQVLELGIIILDNEVQARADFSSPLVQVQNRKFDGFVRLVSGEDFSDVEIAESPGVGNSRVANGVKLNNSLEPEGASVLITNGRELGVFSKLPAEDGSYIRISQSNILASGVIVNSSVSSSDVNNSSTGGNEVSTETTSPPYQYNYSPVYNKPASLLSIKNNFNPEQSCRKFGGINCEEKGYDNSALCTGVGFNKSLFPEVGYGTELPDQTLPIDRALGKRTTSSRAEINMSRLDSNYSYSQQGLTELSRTSVLKDNEMLCASIKNPFEYGACISMLKCKRFKPPYRGKYFFEFCPRTLYGGRLAP